MKIKENPKAPEIRNFAIVIGAMKSGTTTLYKYLMQHPEIAKSRRKEPNFFGLNSQWKKGPGAYLKLWPGFDARRHRYALEASTHYTKSRARRVARRMRRFDGEFRCIYILRHPIDRIESQIAHNIAHGRIAAEAAEPSERAVQISRYARQLDAFRKGLKGEAKILILDFEEMKRDPMATLSRCVAFLEIDPGFAFAPIPPANVRKTANGADRFRLGEAERAALAERLRPDVEALRDRYGFDVSGWGIV